MKPISEQLQQEILAYVEGSLPASEAARVEVLLDNGDPEIAELVRGLMDDRDALRHLPRPAAPVDLAERIMEHVERNSLLGTSVDHQLAREHRQWFASRMAIAAGLLAIFGVFGYFIADSIWRTQPGQSWQWASGGPGGAGKGGSGSGADAGSGPAAGAVAAKSGATDRQTDSLAMRQGTGDQVAAGPGLPGSLRNHADTKDSAAAEGLKPTDFDQMRMAKGLGQPLTPPKGAPSGGTVGNDGPPNMSGSAVVTANQPAAAPAGAAMRDRSVAQGAVLDEQQAGHGMVGGAFGSNAKSASLDKQSLAEQAAPTVVLTFFARDAKDLGELRQQIGALQAAPIFEKTHAAPATTTVAGGENGGLNIQGIGGGAGAKVARVAPQNSVAQTNGQNYTYNNVQIGNDANSNGNQTGLPATNQEAADGSKYVRRNQAGALVEGYRLALAPQQVSALRALAQTRSAAERSVASLTTRDDLATQSGTVAALAPATQPATSPVPAAAREGVTMPRSVPIAAAQPATAASLSGVPGAPGAAAGSAPRPALAQQAAKAELQENAAVFCTIEIIYPASATQPAAGN